MKSKQEEEGEVPSSVCVYREEEREESIGWSIDEERERERERYQVYS